MADYAGSVDSKRVLESMPGRRYDDLYYNPENSKVQLIENVSTFGKYKVNLSSAFYGGTSSVTFPNLNFIGKCYLHFEIPVPNFEDPNMTRITLCNGWALSLINNVELLIGNANISSQRIDKISMYHSLVASKQTADDLKFDLNAAGECATKSFPADPLQRSSANIIDGKYVADVILDLPWSNYCSGMSDKLYFDTSLLTAPITLNITLNGANSIWGTTYVPPNDRFTAQLLYRQLELTDRNESLRNKLFSSPKGVISYPSLYRQSFYKQFNANTGVNLNTFDLTSFLNSDLFAISLSVHFEQDWNPTVGTATEITATPANPWNTLPIYNIELKFGGDPIYIAPGYSNQLCNQESNVSAVYLDNCIVYNPLVGDTPGPPGTIAIGTTRNYVTFINMTRLNPYCADGSFGFPNTIKLPKQVLQLQFQMPEVQQSYNGTNLRQTRAINGKSCILHAIYYYPMITEINATGSVNIFYN